MALSTETINNKLANDYATRFILLLKSEPWDVESKSQLSMLFDFYSAGVLETTAPISREILKLDAVIGIAKSIVLNQNGLL
ncbi:MAG: hypothetical protein KME47_09540 [Nodosilinea sp. WJT8-NPBG4]|jgi:hypothetical protein|nr:hypothetical protein [Nodosilinea sp. WJT8-NPBG4]